MVDSQDYSKEVVGEEVIQIVVVILKIKVKRVIVAYVAYLCGFFQYILLNRYFYF